MRSSRFSTVKDQDHKLIQIVDAALADAARRSGKWLVCRPGCTQCCIGVFSINQLDALRLQRGLADLDRLAPARAAEVRARARDAVARLAKDFPGDTVTGILYKDEEAERRFAELANDEPCPALDPATGVISGTPTAKAKAADYTFTVDDSSVPPITATKVLNFEVK